jgi:hypothetical protein
MTANTVAFDMTMSSNQTTRAGTLTYSFGIYTYNAGSLSLLNSAFTSITFGAVSNNSTAYGGRRWLTIHSSQWSAQPTFSQTNYWVGMIQSSSSQTQQIYFFPFEPAVVGNNFNVSGSIGVAATSLRLPTPFFGIFSAGTNAFPATIGSSGLNTAGFVIVPRVVFNNLNKSF